MSESKNNPTDITHVREQLSDYMDGLLPSDAHDAVRAHLEECADCRAEYVELKATQQLLQAMPAIAAPRSFTLTPEMAGTARKASFWERFFVPQNAPRLATGSVFAFLLLFFFLASSSIPGKFEMQTSPPESSQYRVAPSGAPQATDTPFSSALMAAPTSTTAAAEPSAGGAANQSERAPSPENTPGLAPNTEVGTGGTSGITTTTSDVAPAPPSSAHGRRE